MSDGKDIEQIRFRNGRLIRNSPHSSPNDDLAQPNQETGFRVAIKSGALEANQTLEDIRYEFGDTITFATRTKAETFAAQLSATDGDLRIQAAAPNDTDNVDAYLLADHSPSLKEPVDTDGETWTFDIGANLYGTLGEAILLESPKPHALHYFVRQDLNLDRDELEVGLNIDVQAGKFLSLGKDQKNWVPDCKIIVRDRCGGPVLEQYYCEIKTGNASFERTQLSTMKQLARDERVLKIRMLIEELPDQYSLRIHEVEPYD